MYLDLLNERLAVDAVPPLSFTCGGLARLGGRLRFHRARGLRRSQCVDCDPGTPPVVAVGDVTQSKRGLGACVRTGESCSSSNSLLHLKQLHARHPRKALAGPASGTLLASNLLYEGRSAHRLSGVRHAV